MSHAVKQDNIGGDHLIFRYFFEPGLRSDRERITKNQVDVVISYYQNLLCHSNDESLLKFTKNEPKKFKIFLFNNKLKNFLLQTSPSSLNKL
ncbi:hypothetical protein BpHYR1_034424 [Brachionus plicatilis]|uniref:Uncharacterized protein n=1 Tax=Brachionus plicatilis TaxID=10195 RepID=A0A3M7TAD2_BRAPC|nr:hypothetical protein BpHYR1_034424 [Brachionus plicatilis]